MLAVFAKLSEDTNLPINKLMELAEKTKMAFFDFDGCVINNEDLQMWAFAKLLNEKTHSNYDYREIAKVMVGKSERTIIEEFKSDYGLEGKTDDLLAERKDLYLNAVYLSSAKNPIILNKGLISFAEKAKIKEEEEEEDKGKRKKAKQAKKAKKAKPIYTAILSNGRDEIIRSIAGDLGITRLFDEMFLVDSPARLNADGAPIDKVDFILMKATEKKVKASSIVLFEDSKKTIEKAQEHGIQCVYVVHDHVADPHFVPNTGIVLNFGQTEGLHPHLPATMASSREIPVLIP
ncbi:MAG: HAD family hydrolase [Alphaproteobacteria bacterium]|nr:HAD family hydrolase [Alphaproteobacteria bacterium]